MKSKRGRPRSSWDISKALELKARGKNYIEISAITGINKDTIRRAVVRFAKERSNDLLPVGFNSSITNNKGT